ncbi:MULTISPECIES: hypothetical protein [unclassified Haladaptatus]|uniref:hypothetical protein n=1 Tax=unclassified Haladaptatus TaxID=2622732 RepID=UPI0023E7B205|nr:MULTISPECIES: hypothetical protein [unclassified Haladaptatus]
MTSTQTAPLSKSMFALFVRYRYAIYAAGLVAIALPAVLARGVGYTVAPTIRTALVVGSLTAMAVTYLAERSAGDERDAVGTESTGYSLRRRASAAGAVAGIALGAYLAVTGELVVGLLFIGGALLFGQLAFGGGRRDE